MSCCSVTVPRVNSILIRPDQVDKGEDEDPHHVNEVPVEAKEFDGLFLVTDDFVLEIIPTNDINMMMPTLT